jgi:hypothetical protein
MTSTKDDVEVHIELAGATQRVGTLHVHARRGGLATSFQYHPDWLVNPARRPSVCSVTRRVTKMSS